MSGPSSGPTARGWSCATIDRTDRITKTARPRGLLDLRPVRAQKEAIRWVRRFLDVCVAEAVEVCGEACPLVGRDLDAGEHPPIVRAVIAVMEHADVPAGADRFQELQ